MRLNTTTCDRCDAVATETDFFWQLEFSRSVIIEDMTEFTSEAWDLCEACYASISPSVFILVQPVEDA